MKKLQHTLYLLLMSLLCIGTFSACDDDEPEAPGSDEGLDKVYATMSADGLVTDDLFELADVKVTFSATGYETTTFEAANTAFTAMSRYEILRPAQPAMTVKVTATPKLDIAQRLAKKDKWTLISDDSYMKFQCRVTSPKGKHIRTGKLECTMQPQKNLTAEQVKQFFMQDQNWSFTYTYKWGSSN